MEQIATSNFGTKALLAVSVQECGHDSQTVIQSKEVKTGNASERLQPVSWMTPSLRFDPRRSQIFCNFC